MLHRNLNAHGLPSRVRCDKGGENVLVSEYMLNHTQRGPGRAGCITGRSVHAGCVSLYYELFSVPDDNELLRVGCKKIYSVCIHTTS